VREYIGKGCWYIYEDSPRALTSCILFIKHGVLSWDRRDGEDDTDLLLIRVVYVGTFRCILIAVLECIDSMRIMDEI